MPPKTTRSSPGRPRGLELPSDLGVDQIDVIVKLLRMNPDTGNAVKCVLMDKGSLMEAAARFGFKQPHLSRALTKIREAHATIVAGYMAKRRKTASETPEG